MEPPHERESLKMRKSVMLSHAKTTLNLGIVGACGRGASFKAACDALGHVAVHAVCDTSATNLAAARERFGAREQYTDYAEMLERSALDAVIIGTPIQLHAPQAIAALERNISVLSEVTAGVSIEECRRLVLACKASRGVYMMAENYTQINGQARFKALRIIQAAILNAAAALERAVVDFDA